VRVEEDAYYANKLPQNVGLETWIWRQIVTSQRAHTKYKSPPYVIEWNPPVKIFCVRHWLGGTKKQLMEQGCSQMHFPQCTVYCCGWAYLQKHGGISLRWSSTKYVLRTWTLFYINTFFCHKSS